MASPRIEYAVLPAGEGPGQDRCFTADGLVVVLDGASAIDPVANPDATEYVDTLGPLLVEQITSTPGVDLREALAEAIRRTTDKLTLVPGTAPSSTVSVVRWGSETVDALVLGDSPIVIQLKDGRQETVVQSPQDHIESELRQLYKARLAAGSGYDDEHRRILSRIQQSESLARNQAGGYFIAEASPAAVSHATCRSWSTVLACSAVVASDGVGRLAFEIRDNATAGLLRQKLREMQDWECKNDPSGLRRPRSKRHDDKTLAIIVGQ